MRISTLTNLAVTACLVLGSISIILIVLMMGSINEERNYVNRQIEFRQLGNQLGDASDFLTQEARRYSIYGDKRHYDAFLKEVNEVKTRDRVVNRLRELNAPQNELELIKTAKENSDALVVTEQLSMVAAANGDLKEAQRLMFNEEYDRNKSIIMQPIKEFQRTMNQRVERDVQQAREDATYLLWITSTTITLFILLVFLVFYFVYNKKIIEPLSRMTKVMGDLVSGNTETDIPYSEQQNEIGELANVAQILKSSLQDNQKLTKKLSLHKDDLERQISERTLELTKVAQEAKQANRIKSEFLANMSHEIRTPMNGVIGLTNLLFDTQLSKQQRKYLKNIKRSSNSLLVIINDILDVSKIEAGQLEFELIEFDLGLLLENLATTMYYSAEIKGVELICPASPMINKFFNADRGRISQILTNLIGNAIKFTESGEVAVFVNIESQSASHSLLRFKIKDTGIGIDQAQQQKLFNKFTQADSSTTRKYGGTGLGLAISKLMVELMGGEIGVTSESGQGATFWFTLNLENATAKTAPIPKSNLTDQKILVVDSNKTNRKLFRQLFKNWQIEHTLASSDYDAICLFQDSIEQNKPYTIALIDYRLPNMPGTELCQHLSQYSKNNDTKFVLLAPEDQHDDADIIQAFGVSGYLRKPTEPSRLFNALLQVVQGNTQTTDSASPSTFTTHQYTQFKASVLLVEDNSINQLVASEILKQCGVTVDIAKNGEEALEALKQFNYDLVFMDNQMPVMDGFEATRQIRDPKSAVINHAVPVIAMTANAMQGDRENCLNVGMDDYISKPITHSKISQALANWLPTESIVVDESLTSCPDSIVDTMETEELVFDNAAFSQRLMHKPEMMRTAVKIFVEDTKKDIDNLRLKIAEKDAQQVSVLLHDIKGSSATVGGMALSALAQEMEQQNRAGNTEAITTSITTMEMLFDQLKIAMVDEQLLQ